MNIKGLFLVFEGIDGSGHTTIFEMVADWLTKKGHDVITTHEPTKYLSPGQKARQILKSKKPHDKARLQQLMIEDRKLHEREIKNWLQEGKTVLCDRYLYSTIAFGAADSLSRNELIKLNSQFIRPRAVFLFDVSAETAMNRIKLRGQEKELFEKRSVLTKVRKNYLDLAADRDFKEIIVIDASGSIEEVLKDTLQDVKRVINFPDSFL